MTNGLLTRGFSETARFIEETKSEGRRHLKKSNAFGIDSGSSDELATAWEECRQPNWDGFWKRTSDSRHSTAGVSLP